MHICTILAKSPWDTQQKHTQNCKFVKTPCMSLLLYLHDSALVTAFLQSRQSKRAYNNSGCEGCLKFNIAKGGGGYADLQGFCESVPQLLAMNVDELEPSVQPNCVQYCQ